MEQASPTSIVRCNNIYSRRRKEKDVNPDYISSPAKSGQNPPENTDIHNPLKKTSGGFSIYHKKRTRAISKTIIGGDELPVDSIYNILSRMPLKSLARFQCVSKVWCKYINDPYLEVMHAKRAMKDPTMLLMFQFDRRLKYPHVSASLTMLVTKEEEKSATHEEVVITRKNRRYMEFDSNDCGHRCNFEGIIIGSCKGLIVSSRPHDVDGTNSIVLLVINPLKKECYELPPIKIWSCTRIVLEREACGLGFDDSTNTYKMVCVVLRNQQKKISWHDDGDVVKEDLCTMIHDVLGGPANSSSSPPSWREIPAVPAYPISGEAVFANGCLHWLVSKILKYWPFHAAKKVICFDMIKEEFGLIDPPNTRMHLGRDHLVDLDGQVGLVYDYTSTSCVEVWLLNHQTKCWLLHCRFDRKPPLPLYVYIKVIGYWNNKDDAGDLIITDAACRKSLFIYRLKQGVLQESNFICQGRDASIVDIRLYQTTFSSILHRTSINNNR